MSDLAQRFTSAREASGFTLADVERSTRIRSRFLEAIETGDYARLPDGLPARGFVRLYARFLGMDEEQALADYDIENDLVGVLPQDEVPPMPTRERMQSQYTRPQIAPAKANATWRGALPAPDDPDLLDVDFSRTRRSLAELDEEDDEAVYAPAPTQNARASNQPARTSFTLNETPVIDNINFKQTLNDRARNGANGARQKSSYTSSNRSVPGTSEQVRRSARSAKALPRPNVSLAPVMRFLSDRRLWMVAAALGAVVLLGVLVTRVILPTAQAALAGKPSAQPTVQIVQVTPVVDGKTAGAVAAPYPALPAGGVQLVLDVAERAWERVKVDGNVVFEGIPSLGPTAPWSARQSVAIETGNAGAFSATVNGKTLGKLGERDATLKRTYDPGGIKDEQL